MNAYALRDDYIGDKNLAYIFHSPSSRNWNIEIADDIGEWDLPCLLDHFAREGIRTIGSYWSREFVRSRIVPPDRQNLGTILKDNRLTEYDEFKLFLISDGRCAQDDCYIVSIKEEQIPNEIIRRQNRYLDSTVIADNGILVTLNSGDVYYIDLPGSGTFSSSSSFDTQRYDRLLAYVRRTGRLTPDFRGCGIAFNESEFISAEDLLKQGHLLPVSSKFLREYASSQIISTKDACEILNCSRQNLDDLVKRGRLTPAPINATCRMYYKSDIIALSNG